MHHQFFFVHDRDWYTMTSFDGDPSLRKSAHGRVSLFHTPNNVQTRNIRISSGLHRDKSAVYHKLLERKQDIACWHCCEMICRTDPLYQVPRSYDPSLDSFYVYGAFCTLACCKAYIESCDAFVKWHQMTIFHKMTSVVYGIHEPIVAAPPRISLQKFGGVMSIDAFRKLPKPTAIIEPPFVSYCMLLEERTSDPSSNVTEVQNPIEINVEAVVSGGQRAKQQMREPMNDDFSEPPPNSMYDTYVSTHAGAATQADGAARKKRTRKADGSIVAAAPGGGTLRRFQKKD